MAVLPAGALAALAAIALVIELAAAANYTVGAPQGSWDLKTDLSAWASSHTFKSGDNLNFSYNPTIHDVLEVTKANYDSCTTAGAIKTHTSGNDIISLSSPGDRYFICGFPGHCQSGMKVQIDTTGGPSTGSPPPSISPAPGGNPPSSGTPPSSGSSPSTPTATLTPEGSPQPGSTPSGAPAMAGKVAASGLIGAGMLIVLAL